MGRRSQGGSPACSFPPRLSQHTKPPLRTGRLRWGGGWQEAHGQSRPLTSPVCLAPHGVLSGGRACGLASPQRTFTSPSQVRCSALPCSAPPLPAPPEPPSSVVEMGQLGRSQGSAGRGPGASLGASEGLSWKLSDHHVAASSSSWVTPPQTGTLPLLLPSRTTEAPKDIRGPPHVRGPQPGGAQVHHRDPPLLCHAAEGDWSR